MKWLVGALLLSLASPGLAQVTVGIPGKPTGQDGYSFDKKQFDTKSLGVRVITYKTPEEVSRAYEKRYGETPGWKIRGFTFPSPNGQCEMHILDPAVDYQPVWIGHEFVHCMYGNWHPNQGP